MKVWLGLLGLVMTLSAAAFLGVNRAVDVQASSSVSPFSEASSLAVSSRDNRLVSYGELAKKALGCLGRSNAFLLEALGRPKLIANNTWLWSREEARQIAPGLFVQNMARPGIEAKVDHRNTVVGIGLNYVSAVREFSELATGRREPAGALWDMLLNRMESVRLYYDQRFSHGKWREVVVAGKLNGVRTLFVVDSLEPAVIFEEGIDLQNNRLTSICRLNPSFNWRDGEVVGVYVGEPFAHYDKWSSELDRETTTWKLLE